MSRRIQRLICKNFINKSGVVVLLKRPPEDVQLDKYGEPIDGNVFITNSRELTIVVIKDKREVDETIIGGLPKRDNKEMLHFYCSGTEDIKTGDKIVYPPNTPNEWIIFYVEPTFYNGMTVMLEAKCHRDMRY
jgi:hypothetical protein